MQTTPTSTLPAPAKALTFATRQVAQLLGIGEATVKRMADSGKLPSLREGRARRFAAARVAQFLRAAGGGDDGVEPAASSSPFPGFAAAAREENLNLGLACLLAALVGGWNLGRALAELVEPALSSSLASGDWFLELLSRLPPLDAVGIRPRPALVWSSAGRTAYASSVCCLLRDQGFEVLIPADRLGAAEIIALASNAGVRHSVVVLSARPDPTDWATQVAARLAHPGREDTVVLYCPTPDSSVARSPAQRRSFELPLGVRKAHSIGELASILGRRAVG